MPKNILQSGGARTTLALLTGLLLAFADVRAADEACTTCGGRVTVTGDFTHRQEAPYPRIEGAGANGNAYYEDVNGPQFLVTVSNLPAGKYGIEIGAAETTATAAGQRVFSVSAGDTVLARDLVIIRMNFRKGQEAVAIAAIIHERSL